MFAQKAPAENIKRCFERRRENKMANPKNTADLATLKEKLEGANSVVLNE